MARLLAGTREQAMAETTDAQLIARCRAGDVEAFGRIYERHEGTLYRHALYLLGQREDADDVKQETFLRAYRTMATFRNDYNIRTWLFKICTNLCTDVLRRRQRRPQVALESEGAAHYLADEARANDPVRLAERTHTVSAVLGILQSMPLPQRQAITLYLLEGFDYTQIAEILGCARGAAKMRVLRAMEQYRERVAAIIGDDAY
ncbi:MAG TPA: RNA polymerase sigma factor [Chthonomonadaceae bacterium]|nr:RNA polymerase sigma factor [Chthonomonadaceae bacterium]